MLQKFLDSLRSSYVVSNLLGMVLFVVVAVVGLAFATSIYTKHGHSIQIPDVTHMSQEDAFIALEHAGLVPVVADSGYNRTMASGAILFQQPAAGTSVKEGREVYLTVNSTSSPTLVLPNIADNCDVHEAEIRLKAMGFKVGPCEYVTGDKDWVIAVKCRGREVYEGERVAFDAVLTLVVGNTDMEQGLDEEEEEDEFDVLGGEDIGTAETESEGEDYDISF